MQKLTTLIVIAIMSLVNLSIGLADTPQATIESLATDDLLAVGYVDLDAVDLGACLDWANEQNLVPPDFAPQLTIMTGAAKEFLRQAKKAGADHVFALVRQEDLNLNGSALFVVSIADGHDADETFKSLNQSLGLIKFSDFEMEVWNNVVIGGTRKQIARVKNKPIVERPDVVTAWQKFGGQDAGLMIFGNQDVRRVIRELWPELDSPFEKMTGALIADNLIGAGITIDLPTELGAKVILQAADSESASEFRDAANALKKIGLSKLGEMATPEDVSFLSTITPEVSGNDVVLDLGPVLRDNVQLERLLVSIFNVRGTSQQTNKIRMIILAMLNFESAHRAFPAYAVFDKNEKPLLSWRVQILPFVDENELYQKFKLDEPWDSPHNIKLVDQMPLVFADSSADLAELKRAGKTRFVMPYGESCFFSGTEGTTLDQILDGSSNTIAVVTVVPDAAVIWTKPGDWNVDLENPKKGLFNDTYTAANIARGDGSSELLDSGISSETLKSLITKDGGEIPGSE